MREKELEHATPRALIRRREEGSSNFFPGASIPEAARSFVVPKEKPVRGKGMILIVSAGTSDIPVAEEAYSASILFGNSTERLYDVGVAGIHRLFGDVDLLKKARVIIVAAVMEGALPSIVAGIVGIPVLAIADERRLRGRVLRSYAALLSIYLDSC